MLMCRASVHILCHSRWFLLSVPSTWGRCCKIRFPLGMTFDWHLSACRCFITGPGNGFGLCVWLVRLMPGLMWLVGVCWMSEGLLGPLVRLWSMWQQNSTTRISQDAWSWDGHLLKGVVPWCSSSSSEALPKTRVLLFVTIPIFTFKLKQTPRFFCADPTYRLAMWAQGSSGMGEDGTIPFGGSLQEQLEF